MTGKIASSTAAAQNAVTKLTGKNVDLSKKAISFSGSTVSSMTDGLTITNQIVGEVSSLAECVWSQAEKFPQIAEMMEYQDRQAAHQIGGVVY